MKKMTKVLALLMAFTVFFAVTAADYADARPRAGGFKSGVKSFSGNKSSTTDKSSGTTSGSNVNKSTTTNGSKASATNTNRGFFSGGSFMKGLMIGGLAGMLFGGMFGGLGALGDLFGLIINLLAIYVLFIAVRGIYRMVKANRRNSYNDRNDDQRSGRF